MEKIKQYKYIIILISIILLGIFYWFQLRPTQIRKECSKNLIGFSSIEQNGEKNYNRCLREKGLDK